MSWLTFEPGTNGLEVRALLLEIMLNNHGYSAFTVVQMTRYPSFFYIHGSVHRDSILIRSNEMQQYAGVYLLQNYSTCFGCLSHPSSGLHQTVTVASGTGL